MSLLDSVKSVFGLAEEEKELYLRPLKSSDLSAVLTIEKMVYNFPWSDRIFKDCLTLDYSNLALIKRGELIGYSILSIAVGEAHILNVCVHPEHQRQGLAKFFILDLLKVAKKKNAETIFLEVRPSNLAAVSLYEGLGFQQIGHRKDYYPAEGGREDAVVYSLDLNPNVT
ncbi:MAG: ribosomal-protein-alanine N-acetyltransferase RimI [Cycloclasticus sp. symbiont of Poecilosclerida sp. M]|nr:MAG: ribosomal-protein-alanine N-acetyltransferase RimI [Cycloclasticus sp. symbiont of Poecilosclerida sp. M]